MIKYTKDYLQKYIDNSFNFSDLVRKLGLKPNGGANTYLRNKVRDLGVDCSNFSKYAANKSIPGFVRKGRKYLVKLLINSGTPYICAVCLLPPTWSGKPLKLQVDHIDGDALNNCISNLRFLCPNCHSQTETFCAKHPDRMHRSIANSSDQIVDNNYCNIEFSNCRSCNKLFTFNPKVNNGILCGIQCSKKVTWPPNDVLQSMVLDRPSSEIAKELGCTDTIVSKYCKRVGIKKPPRGYWQKYKAGKCTKFNI